MAFKKEDTERLIILTNEIESNKKHKYDGATYKDSPALKEISKILESHLAKEKPYDAKTLTDSILFLRYISRSYDEMCRVGVSVKYYKLLLELERELICTFGQACPEFSDDFYHALKARNYYVDDDCSDLTKIASGCMSMKMIEDVKKRIFQNRRTVRYDPVEMSEEYLAVIDEVERHIEETATMPGFCIERWNLMTEYLAQYGINWRSPVLLNPNTLFD